MNALRSNPLGAENYKQLSKAFAMICKAKFTAQMCTRRGTAHFEVCEGACDGLADNAAPGACVTLARPLDGDSAWLSGRIGDMRSGRQSILQSARLTEPLFLKTFSWFLEPLQSFLKSIVADFVDMPIQFFDALLDTVFEF